MSESFLHQLIRLGKEDKALARISSCEQYELEAREPRLLQTPLHYAARFGMTEVAKALLEAGVAPCPADDAGSTPLHEAVCAGNLPLLEMLLQRTTYVDPQVRDRGRKTPLMLAIEYKNIPIVQALLAAGAQPLLQDKWNQNSLDLARKTDDAEIINILSRAQVNPPPRAAVSPIPAADTSPSSPVDKPARKEADNKPLWGKCPHCETRVYLGTAFFPDRLLCVKCGKASNLKNGTFQVDPKAEKLFLQHEELTRLENPVFKASPSVDITKSYNYESIRAGLSKPNTGISIAFVGICMWLASWGLHSLSVLQPLWFLLIALGIILEIARAVTGANKR